MKDMLGNCKVIISNSEELSKLREFCTKLGIVRGYDRASIKHWAIWIGPINWPLRVFFEGGMYRGYVDGTTFSGNDYTINELLCAENNFNNNFLGEIK